MGAKGWMFFGKSQAGLGRLGLMWLAVCALLAPQAGCARSAAAPEPAIIRFAHFEYDTAHYDGLVRKFNEGYSGITVELSPRAFRAENIDLGYADVFVIRDWELNVLREQGKIQRLNPFIDQTASFTLDDFYAGALGAFTREGETWTIPYGVDPVVMYYHRDLFDQYGVPYPEIGWTWSDFLDTALALRHSEFEVFGYGAPRLPSNPIEPLRPDPLLFVYQHGGRITNDLQFPTCTTFDHPLTIEAVEWYAELILDHDVAPTTNQAAETVWGSAVQSRLAIFRGIRQGFVGLWTGPISERGGQWTFWHDWEMDWGMVPLPRDAQSATAVSVEGYALSPEAEHPDACWQWIAFLSEQMPYRLMPARRSLAESTAYEQLAGSDVAAVARASMDGAVVLSPRAYVEVVIIFEKAVVNVIAGRSTPEEAMDWAQREAERLCR